MPDSKNGFQTSEFNWGNLEQQSIFGKIWPLWNGDSAIRNRPHAVKKLIRLAEQGYAPAQYSTGMAYYDGDGVRRDYTKAFKFFMTSAEQEYPGAEGMVGNFYLMATPKHSACKYCPEQAYRWHQRSAQKGNSSSQYNLAFSYWNGRGVVKNAVEAYIWASASVHCSSIRNRMSEVLRDEVRETLSPEQETAAHGQISKMQEYLPLPWSEPSVYWKLLAEQAGNLNTKD